MGDYRITIEAVGGHGCGRDYGNGTVNRCRRMDCPDCLAERFVRDLQSTGNSVASATLEHWPVPGACGTGRTENPGPIDDLKTSVRRGHFGKTPYIDVP